MRLWRVVGTGGTITGCGEFFKEKNPQIKVIAVEPATSPVLSGGDPGPHKIQGIGAGFIPKVLNRKILDRVITVTDHEAYQPRNSSPRRKACWWAFLPAPMCSLPKKSPMNWDPARMSPRSCATQASATSALRSILTSEMPLIATAGTID